MKKLVLLVAVVFSTAMISCGNGEKKAAEQDTVAAAEVVEAVVAEADTTLVDSLTNDTVTVVEVAEAAVAE